MKRPVHIVDAGAVALLPRHPRVGRIVRVTESIVVPECEVIYLRLHQSPVEKNILVKRE